MRKCGLIVAFLIAGSLAVAVPSLAEHNPPGDDCDSGHYLWHYPERGAVHPWEDDWWRDDRDQAIYWLEQYGGTADLIVYQVESDGGCGTRVSCPPAISTTVGCDPNFSGPYMIQVEYETSPVSEVGYLLVW